MKLCPYCLAIQQVESGKWEDKLYRQYFNTDGTTIFAQDGSRSAQGRWRINKKTDEYERIWPGEVD